jgi:glycerol-3-phosphate dehydrogenase subunit B
VSRDAVVVGAGLAGLVAAIRLAEEGRDVAVYAAGHGALPLSPAVIDVLGYAGARVGQPASDLPAFLAGRPGHPLARIGAGVLEAGWEWFLRLAAPLGYQGSLQRNLLLPTAVGGLRPTAMAPETMAAGDLSAGGAVLIVGIRGYRDFYPQLLAANLSAVEQPDGARIRARAVEVGLPGDALLLRPQLLARRLEERRVRAELASSIRSELAGEEAVGLPAVLGLQHSHQAWSDLQDWLGRPDFEIPSLPPSISGLRLQALLLRALRRAQGRLVVGAAVVGARSAGGRVTAVVVAEPSR